MSELLAPSHLLAEVILGGRQWLVLSLVFTIVALAVLVRTYMQTSSTSWLKTTCFELKDSPIVLLALCLIDPLYLGQRPKPGSNLFLVAADNSRRLQLADPGARQSRGSAVKE